MDVCEPLMSDVVAPKVQLLRMDVCEPLMSDVVATKVQQTNRSYVTSADLPSDSLHKILAWWAVTQRTLKTTKLSNLGGGCLPGYGDNTVHIYSLVPRLGKSYVK